MGQTYLELCAEQLRRRCRTGRFPFSSTAEGLKLEGIIGQERATRAIEFGLDVPYPGYNIYALVPAGAGKGSIISYFLESKAATRPGPPTGVTCITSTSPIVPTRCVCRRAEAPGCA